MKKTEWFKGSVRPKHIGAYETIVGPEKRNSEDCWFNWWDGDQWCVSAVNAKAAEEWASIGSTHLTIKWWRGLTEKAA